MPAFVPAPVPLVLALQGGGSFGAFTWGVLDRLLDEPAFVVPAISGTSSGALNAAVMATGFAQGGAQGARDALGAFWRDVSRAGSVFSPFSGASTGAGNPFRIENLPGFQWANTFMRSFSPYEFNPLNLNPLQDLLHRHVDEDALHGGPIRLFVTATNVQTGLPRVFSGNELGVPALMASACLPFVFQAVEIDGESFWDGGYTGNPAIHPLIYETDVRDMLLVKVNPLARAGTPTRSMDIIDRLGEISFNTTLLAEMRAIGFVSRLLRERRLDADRYKDVRFHMVDTDDALAELAPASKFNTEQSFLDELFEHGRGAASQWLRKHRGDVGTRASLDVDAVFLGKPQAAPRRRKPGGQGA